MIRNKYAYDSERETPILQANDGDKIFNLYINMTETPISKTEIAELLTVGSRNVNYYVDALASMNLAWEYIYGKQIIYGLTDEGHELQKTMKTKSSFANYLTKTKYITNEKDRLKRSSLDASTVMRRMQAIDAIKKWIGENK